MTVALPNPLIPKLAEALGLEPERCRSIDLHMRTDDVLTVSAQEYVSADHADHVIKVVRHADYALVPKGEYVALKLLQFTDAERNALKWAEAMLRPRTRVGGYPEEVADLILGILERHGATSTR